MTDTLAPEAARHENLTARQQRFVQRAAELADDFATRAAEHDRDGSFPFENFQKLHDSGYASMCLPAALGGEDADLLEFTLAQERLGQGCASTALGANMHGFATGFLSELYRGGDQSYLMPLTMVGQMKMTLGCGLSETDSADPMNFPSGTVERVTGGYRLNGRKVFGSNTPISMMVCFNGILEEDGRRKAVMFTIPKETPGVVIKNDWNTMGMRATGSVSVEFKDCYVGDMFKTMEMEPGGGFASSPWAAGFLCWFEPSVSGVYLGIAAAARQAAVEYVRERTRRPFGAVKHSPGVQYGVAEMFINHEAARGFMLRTAQRLSDPGWRDQHAVALAVATKQFVTKQALAIVDQAMEVIGGASFFKRMPIERFYRDARAGIYHPPSRWDTLEYIGKTELGIPETQQPRFV
ncbi:MAG: acyl-CoA dehydrogenase family protein [Dehalococcoidia bacterium]